MFQLSEMYHPPEGQKQSNSVLLLLKKYETIKAIAAGLGSDLSQGLAHNPLEI